MKAKFLLLTVFISILSGLISYLFGLDMMSFESILIISIAFTVFDKMENKPSVVQEIHRAYKEEEAKHSR